MKLAFRIAIVVIKEWILFHLISPALSVLPQEKLAKLSDRLTDWAQLKYYHQANALLSPAKNNENRIVFFGDSITEFWDLGNYFPDKPYINRGIAGQTTPQMLVRFRADVISLKPKVVIILAGINDIAGNTGLVTLSMIEDNYASMAELAQANQIQVIFASVLPIHDYGSIARSQNHLPTKIRTLNDWLQRYCLEHNHIYLNYYSQMLDPQEMLKAELADDGLHPNSKGYQIMTALAETAIEKALQPLSYNQVQSQSV
ncbi:SGNH/GDSL hydrolase family protein [Floridanema evergladense]|uniref:SGNH/GDSL hydrolase family protein n=1 Tax=Floridaenema evergladense BLCC-F167 TaxID=3153639 RepID=A0ABV4WRE0_9CYAN